MTTNTEHAKELLSHQIELAKEYDRRGDVTLRDQTISQLLGDENGLSVEYVRAAIRNAGLRK